MIAIQLRQVSLFSKRGYLLSLLILPTLIGDVSIAFIGKVIFANSTLLHENSTFKFVSLIFLQFWQYGTLFTYIFWLVIQNIKDSIKDFSVAIKMSNAEYVKDIVLPSIKNVAILGFVLNFIFAFFENAKSQFIFRASSGTNSEFISKWLEQYYQSSTLFNIETAISSTLQFGVAIMLTVIFLTIIFAIFFSFLYKEYLKANFHFPSIRNEIFSNSLFIFLLFFVVAPIFLLIFILINATTIYSDNLFPVILITAITAFISTIISKQIGILLRLAWKNIMSTFSKKSIVFYASLMFILLFPPLVLYILGFKWLSLVGYQSPFLIYCVWVFCHILLILPVLSSFIAVTHYRTTNNEIEFLDVYKLTYKEKVKVLFNRRYFLDYSLTFLIAFSFIWNESTVNNLLSDFIPSFISEMKMSISGRGTDYSNGIGFFFISITLALMSIILWSYIIRKIKVKSL